MSSNLMPHLSAPVERTLLSTSPSLDEADSVTASYPYNKFQGVVGRNDFAYAPHYADRLTHNVSTGLHCRGLGCYTPKIDRSTPRYSRGHGF